MTDQKMTFTVEVEGMPIPEVKWYVFNKVCLSAISDIILITITITVPVLLYTIHLWFIRLEVRFYDIKQKNAKQPVTVIML
jgi:hypothetical protein